MCSQNNRYPGFLSKKAERLAMRCGASFLCATCCFTAHAHLRGTWATGGDRTPAVVDALCRLAEMQGNDLISQEAMHTVNALRMETVAEKLTAVDGRLLAFAPDISPKNQVVCCLRTCPADRSTGV
eukprot:NODE_6139_length_876_cov_69.699867_g5908_i0.p2 GENE.NODE_6139_length_876_cov_69.699867_g5908_i0~~NODE_6139_length_876_cov_69.699867_g5908_i0.p2  ORF type:complete len:126 (-),score=10.69 NODE_6139_length_876_cov_69.699867_g5908_i0:77-454(-)